MALITIPVAHFKAQFRPLNWLEHMALLALPQNEYPKRALGLAMVSAGGIPVNTPEDALRILATLPKVVLKKVWLLYNNGLPENRFFTTIGLASAPDARLVRKAAQVEEEQTEAKADKAVQQAEAQFNSEDVKQTKYNEAKMFAAAKKRGLVSLQSRPGTEIAHCVRDVYI